MVLDAVSNFVRGQVDAAVTTSDTTVSVADVSIFPDPATDGEFNVVVWNANNFPRPDQDGDVEILRVTATNTNADELTVVRGQETTAAAAHPSESAVHLSPTAKMFGDIESTFADFWDAGAQDLTADVNNESVTTDKLANKRTGAYLMDENLSWSNGSGFSPAADLSDTSSTSFEEIGSLIGCGSLQIPPGATLYGNFSVRVGSLTEGETATYRPDVVAFESPIRRRLRDLNELEIAVDENTTQKVSGWTEITSTADSDEIVTGRRIMAKVSGGTLESATPVNFGLALDWRVD